MKKAIFTALTLLLMLILMSMGVSAASETDIAYPVEGGNIYFDKNFGVVTYCDPTVTKVNIPAQIDGVSVRRIAFGAFEGCTSLTDVTIAEGITGMGEWAFGNCTSLHTIDIPDSITEIGAYAFYNTAYYNDKNNWDGAVLYLENWLIDADSPTLIGEYNILSGTVGIGVCAMNRCSELSGITIPDSVKYINYHAFGYCQKLASVTIPDSVSIIANHTFSGCRSLSVVYIPDSVTEIQQSAFYECENLKNIYIGSGVSVIEDAAFGGAMPKGRSVYFRGDAPQMGERVFTSVIFDGETDTPYIEEGLCLYYIEGRKGWTTPEWNGYPCMPSEGVYAYEVEGGYLYFDKDAQAVTGCDPTVTNLVIPSQIDGVEVLKIYGYAFSGNATLTSLTLPNSVYLIDDCAFRDCTALKEIHFSEGLKYISMSGFLGCTALKEVILPNSLTNIGHSAFENCEALALINIGNAVTWIEDSAFDNTAYFNNKDNWEDGLLYLENWLLSVGENLEEIHVKAGTIGIAEWCTDASKDTCKVLTFPGSLRYICDHAFYGYQLLTEIVVPKNVLSFGQYAFQDCPSLTAAYFYGDAPDFFPDTFLCWTGYPVFWESFVTFYYIEGTQGWENNEIVPQDYFHPTPWDGIHTHSYIGSLCNICGEGLFGDVSNDAWYADAVDFALSNGLMNGMSATTFEPETQMSRAMLVTVLWRYAGSPVQGENTFTDVENGQWYTQAIAWAAHNGIVSGIGNNRFDPNGTMTREQLATVLFRYSAAIGIDVSAKTTLDHFPDAALVSNWAEDAIIWAVAEGLINGSDGKLLPQGNATRAQVATILMRFIEKVAK